MYEQLDRSPKQNRSTRSPRQPQRQRAEPAQANERIQEMRPPAFTNMDIGNTFNYSPQLTTATQSGSQLVVLLSKINPRRLTVAGEDHSKSEQRREQEQLFYRYITGSNNYCTEPQFKVAAVDSVGNVTEGHDSADPWNLQMLQSIAISSGSIDSIFEVLPRETEYHFLFEVIQPQIINNMESIFDYTDNILFKGTDLLQGTNGQKWIESNGNEVVEEVRARLGPLQAALFKLYPIMDRLNKPLPKDLTKLLENITESLNGLQMELLSMRDIVGKNGANESNANLTHDDISLLRSNAMRREADARANQDGLLKFGQSHYLDIKADPVPPRFNLISMQEFDAAYELWVQMGQPTAF